ncbi:hypothetical protein AB3329_04655 [Streptococcus sp. H31]|uniref:hypothetical protein n=1 Tax=Streptococcus huangxiaojuni TaxID=3237239 RepID=UPI0034A3654D
MKKLNKAGLEANYLQLLEGTKKLKMDQSLSGGYGLISKLLGNRAGRICTVTAECPGIFPGLCR